MRDSGQYVLFILNKGNREVIAIITAAVGLRETVGHQSFGTFK